MSTAARHADEPARIGESISERLRLRLAKVAPQAPADLAEELAAAETERARRRQAERDDRWHQICHPRFALVRWSDVDQPGEVVADLAAWRDKAVRHVEGAGPAPGNLVVVGPNGPGKTYAALAVGKDLHYAGASVVFAPVVELLSDLRRDGRDGTPRCYMGAQVLILDDLGGEKASEWTQERLYEIVNARWLDCLPTIVTTNLEPPDLAVNIGTRSWDRLRHEAVVVRITGPSRREAAP